MLLQVVPGGLGAGLVSPTTLLAAASSAASSLSSVPDVVSTVLTPASAENPILLVMDYLKDVARDGMPARAAVFGPALRALRETFNNTLLEVRLASLYLTLGSAAAACIIGLVLGDRSRPDLPAPTNDDDGLYRTMPRGMAATYDLGSPSFVYSSRAGLAAEEASDVRQVATEGAQFVNDLRPDSFIPISVGLWIELVFCIVLDGLGAASYFYPQLGEVVDGGFAFVYAFAIELFFDWPALALFGFWEEVLPYTDFIPTATLAWILTVAGVRYKLTDRKPKSSSTAAGKARRGVQGPMLIDRLVKNSGELPREKRPARWFDDQWGYLDADSDYREAFDAKDTRTGPNMRDQSGNALP